MPNTQFSYGTRVGCLGSQSVLQAGNFEGVSFAREPGEVLRSDVWVETDQRERRGFG